MCEKPNFIVKQYITPNLLKYLADAYDYDCEGECLATWKFFYEGGGDVGELKSRQITARDGNHVLVENKYVNYEYDVLHSSKIASRFQSSLPISPIRSA